MDHEKVCIFFSAAAILVLVAFNLNLTFNTESKVIVSFESVFSASQGNSNNYGCYSETYFYESEDGCVESFIATCEYYDDIGDFCLQGIIFFDYCEPYMYDAMHIIMCD